MAVTMKITVFQKVIPCSLVESTNVLEEPSVSNFRVQQSPLHWRWRYHVTTYPTTWCQFQELQFLLCREKQTQRDKCETRTYTRLERRNTKGTGIINDTAGECYAQIII